MDKDKGGMKTTKHTLFKETGIVDPKERLKSLAESASAVEVDHNVPPKRYYRSGVEMMRMAEVYINEHSYEHAYTLYVKFITIFVDKIRNHPLYDTVSSKDRALNQHTLRIVIPKAEQLKKQLLQQYEAETEKYLQDVKQREKAEIERLKREEEHRLKDEEDKKKKLAALVTVKAAKEASAAADILAEDVKTRKYPSSVPKSLQSPTNESKAQTSADKKIPTVDRSTKPSLLVSDSLSLRDVVLPNKLLQNFLTLAFVNTMNNKETCGILAGRLERNKLIVTHLLIPKQTGSPDSCITHNEEDIFDYQDQHNLITLGWIHTHPTQTAFLSSVDLHTHCSYQRMMAEAIAIVCAPKYEETGFFILTPDYGLDFIANCRESGFHPHPTEPPLYMKAKHCKLDSTAPIEVVDLRKK